VVVGVGQRSIARPGFAPTAPVAVADDDNDISWTLVLDQALSSGGGVRAILRPLALAQPVARKKRFWQRRWAKILLPTLLISAVAIAVNRDNDHDRDRDEPDPCQCGATP
jgi:hypothetical protein